MAEETSRNPEPLDVDPDDFYEMDLDTGNHLVVIVYNEEDDNLEVENPSELPPPMVRGLLEQALDLWRDIQTNVEISVEDEDD